MMLTFTVYGTPQPAGSKKAFAIKRGGIPTGRVAVSDANAKAAPWKQEIAAIALKAMQDIECEPFADPVELFVSFFVKRPKGHFGKKGLLPSAPKLPAKKPDLLKLTRGLEDALSGIVYVDDCQIVHETLRKEFGLPERVEITLTTL